MRAVATRSSISVIANCMQLAHKLNIIMGRGHHSSCASARRPTGMSAMRRALRDGDSSAALNLLAEAGTAAFERPGLSAIMTDLARSQAQAVCHETDPVLGAVFEDLALSPSATTQLAEYWLASTYEQVLAEVQRMLWEGDRLDQTELERIGRQAKTQAFLDAVAEVAAHDAELAERLAPSCRNLPAATWRRALHRAHWWQRERFTGDVARDLSRLAFA
jgi:hypothetical protein